MPSKSNFCLLRYFYPVLLVFPSNIHSSINSSYHSHIEFIFNALIITYHLYIYSSSIIYSFIHPFVHPSIHLASVHPFAHPSMYYLPIYSFSHSFFYTFIYLFIYLSLLSFIFHPSIHLVFCWFTYLTSIHFRFMPL